jgi:branched-chain amino acid transport system substrate-binding protein
MIRGWAQPAAAIAVAVVVSACGSSSTSHPAATASPTPPAQISIAPGQPITIGVSAALSGAAAGLGTDIADAVDLAIADAGSTLGGHPLVSKRVDDGCSDAEKAVQAARELIQAEGLIGVIGPMCITGAQAADRLYEAAGVIHILPAATRSDLSAQGERYFFRTAWQDDAQAQVQAQYLAEKLSARSVVLIDDGEPYGTTLADAFATAFTDLDGRVLSRERVKRGTVDFVTLAGHVQGAGPDAVVFEGLDPEGALLVKALRDAGYEGSFIASDGLLSVRDFVAVAGDAAEGSIVTGGPVPDEVFASRFRERFQRNAQTPFVLEAHDALTALVRALNSIIDQESGALSIDRTALAEALRGGRPALLTGTIHFDERGDRGGATASDLGLVVYRVTNGRFEPAP